jgi:hypothetical protein
VTASWRGKAPPKAKPLRMCRSERTGPGLRKTCTLGWIGGQHQRATAPGRLRRRRDRRPRQRFETKLPRPIKGESDQGLRPWPPTRHIVSNGEQALGNTQRRSASAMSSGEWTRFDVITNMASILYEAGSGRAEIRCGLRIANAVICPLIRRRRGRCTRRQRRVRQVVPESASPWGRHSLIQPASVKSVAARQS